ncbi:DeoR/GlpR family DNA-binding transcription regulator [Actinotignum urinale]|uniref:DeoR/GlpR family DNA-binding transcription regulator n=1 Tax=Actinotignum urinale TaxID=190146 RepID=A0ABU5G5Z8_9ACTO|nr:DeoR/GlpR family DNA-binding transcription regulator [Actinotignum urinale]MDY5132786.1 DeoR/GlpR family DNA-binding transcription regulator [Actinotignum urinale]MDY5159803.1 DeoR/GlpR family DNA-binding transcription regulator [Actinotignum urinale]
MNKVVERHRRIINLLSDGRYDKIHNTKLAQILNISLPTLRRDLITLEKEGKIIRKYGAVSLPQHKAFPTGRESVVRNMGAKNRIAQRAAQFIHDDEFIIFDAGTTTERLCIALNNTKKLTVATNGLRALNALALQDKVNVLVLGGFLHTESDNIHGSSALAMLDNVHAHSAFMGAQHIHPQQGIASLSYEQASLKTKMMSRANMVYVLADSSKFIDNRSPYWSAFPENWVLITDKNTDTAKLAELHRAGAQDIILV